MVSSKAITAGVALASAFGVTATHVPGSLVATNDVVTYLFTVGLSTLLLSFLGSLLATLIAEPLKPKTKMWAIFLASAIAGATASSLLPYIPGMGWVKSVPSQVIGFFVSLFGRWVIPALIDALPGLTKSAADRIVSVIGRDK